MNRIIDKRAAQCGNTRSSLSLRAAVRLSLSMAVATGVATAPAAQAQPFPPIFQLSSLRPASGGDGSAGSIILGRDTVLNTAQSVTILEDMNGDGIGDFAISAPEARPLGLDRPGEAYVVFGTADGFPAQISLGSLLPSAGGDGSEGFVIVGAEERDYTGQIIADAGDINGDGINDLAITVDPREPELIIVFGRDTTAGDFFAPLLPVGQLSPAGGGDGSEGFSLRFRDVGRGRLYPSAAGDVNGDGLDDLIVGNGPSFVDGDPSESIVLFGRRTAVEGNFPPIVTPDSLRPAAGGDGTQGFIILGIDAGDATGFPVGPGGDINGDGIDDILVGAYNAAPGGNAFAGEAYVLFGRSEPWPALVPLVTLLPEAGGDGSEGIVLAGIAGSDRVGSSVSAGDINADGIDDIVTCGPTVAANGVFTAGECYAVFGRDAALNPLPAQLELSDLLPENGGDGTLGFVMQGATPADELGGGFFAFQPLNVASDVNGDGIDDILIGTQGGDLVSGQNRNEGEVYVVYGRDSNAGETFPAALRLLTLRPGAGGDGTDGFIIAGYSIGGLAGGAVSTGDVNGDGFPDVLIGARGAQLPGPLDGTGVAYLVLGRDGSNGAEAGNP